MIDPRSRFATCERFPAAEDVIAAWPREALEQLDVGIDRATFIAVLTHDPKLDDAILEIALRSTPTWARWAAAGRRPSGAAATAGLTDEELSRVAALIGLDIGALTAEETAVSIMAEMIAVRHAPVIGASVPSSGRIHDAAADEVWKDAHVGGVPAQSSRPAQRSGRRPVLSPVPNTLVRRSSGARGAPDVAKMGLAARAQQRTWSRRRRRAGRA